MGTSSSQPSPAAAPPNEASGAFSRSLQDATQPPAPQQPSDVSKSVAFNPGPFSDASQPGSLASESSEKKEDMCPGTFEELHKPCKDMSPQLFEGIKLVANNGLSQHFQVSHTFTMASNTPSNYHYGATFVGGQQTSPSDAFPVVLGEMNTSGSLNAQIIHQVTKDIRTKCIIQTEKTEWEALQMDASYRGRDFSASAIIVNPDFLSGAGIYLLQYLQSFTPKVALGSEILVKASPSMGRQAVLSAAGLYRADQWRLAASVGPGSIHASYVYKYNDRLQLCAELESSPTMRQNTLTFGYQLEVPQANFTFRGQVDTNWTVASLMEKRLVPYPFTLQLCAMMNHQAQATRVGFGLTVG